MYEHLPYLENINMPTVEFGEAARLRQPLATAINNARHLAPSAMADIKAILHFALEHIDQKEVVDAEFDEEPPALPAPDPLPELDVAASLLGSAEDESDASGRGSDLWRDA